VLVVSLFRFLDERMIYLIHFVNHRWLWSEQRADPPHIVEDILIEDSLILAREI